MDTIYAVATVRGKAGVAVVRVSGPDAYEGVAPLVPGGLGAPRKAVFRKIVDHSGEFLDNGLVISFPENESFTGEKIVEFQIHGSPATQNALLDCLGEIKRFRLADPGEFTRRALENNRLDLAQVEGLADLIDAETDAQRRQALRVLSGYLGLLASEWRQALIRAQALLQATIDFADEEVPEDVFPEVQALLKKVMSGLEAQLAGEAAAERIRSGFEVAIVGPPNVGKSTLLNRFAGRDAALTSDIPGTTRDIVEVRMDIGGLPVTFLDTAGLRETDDYVEGLGVNRAISRASDADLRVFLKESEGSELLVSQKPGDIVLLSKADLRDSTDGAISGKTGIGTTALLRHIEDELSQRASGATSVIRVRHGVAMRSACDHLKAAMDHAVQGEAHTDVAAEELRSAVRALSSIVGLVDVEDVLDEVFSSFCLGK